MITVYTPLSENEAKDILHEGIVDFSQAILLSKILTGKDIVEILADNIEDMVRRDRTFKSTGLIIYTATTSNLITAVDFSKFSWMNRVHYVSYEPDNPPKLIKNLQTAIQQNPR